MWGVAHNLGQATGSLISGGLVDLVRSIGKDTLTAYGLVFALEALLLLAILRLQSQCSISDSRVVSTSPQSER